MFTGWIDRSSPPVQRQSYYIPSVRNRSGTKTERNCSYKQGGYSAHAYVKIQRPIEMQAPTPNPTVSTDKSLWERRAFEKQLLNIIPDLRAFARFLAGNPTEADDLVQDTVVRALNAYDHFDLNTNIKAWTFTILRNIRINSYRKRRFEELDEATMATMSARANQEDSLELKEVLKALETLPAAQREVITLVRAGGLSYEEAAEIMG